MKVMDILKSNERNLLAVDPDTLLSDCVIKMADEDVGSLVVTDGNTLLGLLTFREVIIILAKRQKELRSGPTPPIAELKVKDVMNSKPIYTSPDVELNDLRRLMINQHQRYIPVLNLKKSLGFFHFMTLRVLYFLKANKKIGC